MDEIILLEAVERYIKGEMTPEEKAYFDDLRMNNAEIDQMVVNHHLFLNQLKNYADRTHLKSELNKAYTHLVDQGEIREEKLHKSKIIQLWQRHKRIIAVAACIAGITAVTISGSISYFAPQKSNPSVEILNRVSKLEQKQNDQSRWLNDISKSIPKAPKDQQQKSAGTSFLIDPKGFLITNSHVVNNASTLVVVNNDKEYYAKNIYNDPSNDIAILKIDDKDFSPLAKLPYSVRKSMPDLGEEIFTLGYPRDEIVYGKGYLSAQSGFHADTLSVQISVDANPGNSGGPVLDKNGDIIGILNSRELNANGVVFANKASAIVNALEKLKQDSAYRNIKLSQNNIIKGKERTQQIKQIKDCVFMVKGYYK